MVRLTFFAAAALATVALVAGAGHTIKFCATYKASCNSKNDFGPERRDAHIFARGKAYGKDCVSIVTAMAPGVENATSGNTLACRQYHLKVAGTSNVTQAVHCPHASPDGGGVCVDASTTKPPTTTGEAGTTGEAKMDKKEQVKQLRDEIKKLKSGLSSFKEALAKAKAKYGKDCKADATTAVCKALKTANDASDKSVVDQEAIIAQAEAAADKLESSASAKVVSSAAFVVAAAIATAVF